MQVKTMAAVQPCVSAKGDRQISTSFLPAIDDAQGRVDGPGTPAGGSEGRIERTMDPKKGA